MALRLSGRYVIHCTMARPDRYQPETGAARGINFPAREQCSTHCRATGLLPAPPIRDT